MPEYEIIGVVKARELIKSNEEVYSFVTHMGLFTKEINSFLAVNGVYVYERGCLRNLFPHKNADDLSRSVAGRQYPISYGSMKTVNSSRRRIEYPGKCVYYHGNFFAGSSGYPRIIYEVLDSSVRANPVNVLSAAVEGDGITLQKLRTLTSLDIASGYRHARRLSRLGFISFDGKTLAPKKISRRILSPEVKEVWEKLKEWKHRIDVWD